MGTIGEDMGSVDKAKFPMFGRLAPDRQMDEIVNLAVTSGGVAVRDLEAETIEVYFGNDRNHLMLRAMHKGNGAWLVMYSTEFYAKPN